MSSVATERELEVIRVVDLRLGDEVYAASGLVTGLRFVGPNEVQVLVDGQTDGPTFDPHDEIRIVRPPYAAPRDRHEARALRVGARLDPTFRDVVNDIADASREPVHVRTVLEQDALIREARASIALDSGEGGTQSYEVETVAIEPQAQAVQESSRRRRRRRRKPTPVSCGECGQDFYGPGQLTNHVRAKHDGIVDAEIVTEDPSDGA